MARSLWFTFLSSSSLFRHKLEDCIFRNNTGIKRKIDDILTLSRNVILFSRNDDIGSTSYGNVAASASSINIGTKSCRFITQKSTTDHQQFFNDVKDN